MRLTRWLLPTTCLLGCAPPLGPSPPTAADASAPSSPPGFARGERAFCFAGANAYYLNYVPRRDVLEVLDRALDMHLSVLRVWAFLDTGSFDGAVPHVHERGAKEGVYFQAWDPTRGAPLYNDGPDGLERLDFVVSEARRRGLSLVLVLTNNWRDFGGMDQYLAWYGLERHEDFYVEPRVRAAYRAWLDHVVGRTNALDGVAYRDDPTILAWELANEPRLSLLPAPLATSDPEGRPLTAWADEMSTYLRSLDPHHLIGVGEEGFFTGAERPSYQLDGYGVDRLGLGALRHIDFLGFHLYPEHWGWSWEEADDFVERQLRWATRLQKPLVLGEFGIRAATGEASRRERYTSWSRRLARGGGAGWSFWHLAADVRGAPYPDFDGYTVHPSAPLAGVLSGLAADFTARASACRRPVPSDSSSPFVRVARAR